MFKIAGREISATHLPYIIAEMSGNHNHDLNRAKRLIEEAKKAGADAVKIQTYTADTITIKSDRPEFSITEGLWKGRSLYELYEEAHTPWDWHKPLFEHAKKVGITIFSSPFDNSAVDFLEALDAPAYKVASPEIIDWGLLERMAGTNKPLIVSTGMASIEEIGEALEVLRSNGACDIVMLHCIAAYPTPLAQSNLGRIKTLADHFEILTGLSDHTMGLLAPTTAIALGACVIEKHFTLARTDGGVDSAFSLEASELAELCQASKQVFAAMGNENTPPAAAEQKTHKFRRSLYFVADMKAGDIIQTKHVRSIRPGLGLAPKHLKSLIGKKIKTDIAYGTPTAMDLIS